MQSFEEKIKTLHRLYSIMKPSHIPKLYNIAFNVKNEHTEFGEAIVNGEGFASLLKWYTKLFHTFEK